MTTREEKRFTAAVAAMQGLLSGNHYKGSERLHMCVTMAVPLADDLLNALDKTAPPVAEDTGEVSVSDDTKCDHLMSLLGAKIIMTSGLCKKCGAIL